LKYFLVGVAETAENATQTLSEILKLKAGLEEKLNASFGKRSGKAIMILQYLFKKPVIHVNQVKEITQSSFKTSNDLVNDLVKLGILAEMTGQNRNRVFVFDQYLKLFKYGTVN
jgi:Fic family protein